MSILSYLTESLKNNESYYRITTEPQPTKTNRLYDELDDDVPMDELFGTTKDSLLSWLKLFKEEHPDIEKVYVWEFKLPTPPNIESFTYNNNDYEEFTFDPTDIDFDLYKVILF